MRKTTLAASALITLMFLVAWGNMQGVCYGKLRPLRDEERIRFAVNHLLQNIRPGGRAFAMQGDRVVETQPPDPDFVYQGVDDFLRRNPACCSVVPVMGDLGHAPSAWSRLVGNFSGYVRIQYRDPSDPDVAQRNVIRTSYLAVTNCGDVWDGI